MKFTIQELIAIVESVDVRSPIWGWNDEPTFHKRELMGVFHTKLGPIHLTAKQAGELYQLIRS